MLWHDLILNLLCHITRVFTPAVIICPEWSKQDRWYQQVWAVIIRVRTLQLICCSCDEDHAVNRIWIQCVVMNVCAGWMCAVGTRTVRRRWARTALREPMCRSARGPTAGAGRRTPSSCWPGCSTSSLPSLASVCSSPCCRLTGSLQATSYPQTQSSLCRSRMMFLQHVWQSQMHSVLIWLLISAVVIERHLTSPQSSSWQLSWNWTHVSVREQNRRTYSYWWWYFSLSHLSGPEMVQFFCVSPDLRSVYGRHVRVSPVCARDGRVNRPSRLQRQIKEQQRSGPGVRPL